MAGGTYEKYKSDGSIGGNVLEWVDSGPERRPGSKQEGSAPCLKSRETSSTSNELWLPAASGDSGK